MAAVGTGMRCRAAPELELEQPRARGGAGGRPRRARSSARRSATTSTCATSRAARRCCSSQGQGQQRLLRHRPVHPPVRRHLLARRRAPHRGDARRRGRRTASGSRARRSIAKISRDPADLVAPDDRAGITSIRTAPCCSSAPCSRRSRTATRRARASPTRSATSSPSRRRSSGALVNRMRHSGDCEPWTFGAGALMRNLAARRLI